MSADLEVLLAKAAKARASAAGTVRKANRAVTRPLAAAAEAPQQQEAAHPDHSHRQQATSGRRNSAAGRRSEASGKTQNKAKEADAAVAALDDDGWWRERRAAAADAERARAARRAPRAVVKGSLLHNPVATNKLAGDDRLSLFSSRGAGLAVPAGQHRRDEQASGLRTG
eukprot:COSAG05_NODE_7583_length_793_cov_1.445245_1_plen_169_part_10